VTGVVAERCADDVHPFIKFFIVLTHLFSPNKII
jgi:hypothetical protein